MSSPSSLRKIAESEIGMLLEAFPGEVRAEAAQVPVFFQNRPDPEDLERGQEADLLGLFVGEERGETGETPVPIPPRIHLYLENIWLFAEEDEAGFREELRVTYLHELGHYLGWDEEEMETRGLE